MPGETEATYRHTLDWLETNADVVSHVNVYNLAVYADSALVDELGFAENHTDENRLPAGRAELNFADRVYRFGMKCLGNSKDLLCNTCETKPCEWSEQDAIRCADYTGPNVMIDNPPA